MGISISSLYSLYIFPVPLQKLQGHLIVYPIPLHLLHYYSVLICPSLYKILPLPPQVKHLDGCVPGSHLLPEHLVHFIYLLYFIYFLLPFTESKKLISNYKNTSFPLCGFEFALDDVFE